MNDIDDILGGSVAGAPVSGGPYRAHAPSYHMYQPSIVEGALSQRMGSMGPEGALAFPFYQGAQMDRRARAEDYGEALQRANAVQQVLAAMHARQQGRRDDLRLAGQLYQHGMPGGAIESLLQRQGFGLDPRFNQLGDMLRTASAQASATRDLGTGLHQYAEAGLRMPTGQQTSINPVEVLQRIQARTGTPLGVETAGIRASGEGGGRQPTIGLELTPAGTTRMTAQRFPATEQGVDQMHALAQRSERVGPNATVVPPAARVGEQGQTATPPRPGATAAARTGPAALRPGQTPLEAGRASAEVQQRAQSQGRTIVGGFTQGGVNFWHAQHPRTGQVSTIIEAAPRQ